MQSTLMCSRRKPPVVAFLIVSVLVGTSFSSGWFFGEQRGARAAVPEGEGHLLDKGTVPSSVSDDVNFNEFWNVWNMVKDNYYKQPVSDKSLYYGAMKGMVAAAGDPYTMYFDPEASKDFKGMLSGTFSGIGAEIGSKDGLIVVVAPLKDSPAEKAGLAEGDIILSIDGKDTTKLAVDQAVALIRGVEGTDVKLSVVHVGADHAEDLTITRQVIKIDSVKWSIDKEGFATISIAEFNGDTTGLFNQAVNDVLAKNVKGIVFDLRSDPGGLLTAAIDVASAWTGYQTVVIEKQQDDAQSFPGVSAPRLEGIPTVVLVDGGSASASEIVAGALQDYGLATMVGTQTFGKGSVQDFRDLPDGSSVKITIAAWYTPKGRTINETGLTPDVVVEYTKEDAHAKRDPQKEKALEILRTPKAAAH
ncbi:MAG: S41 family peptidase [Candidatus Uhrbacteria bacterium]